MTDLIAKGDAGLIDYLKRLQGSITAAFSALEGGDLFMRTPWRYERGAGGGEMAVLRGAHFEKAAVNWSAIHGDTFPMEDASGPFFATGLSLITHMANPHAPTAHFNIRYLRTKGGSWFGGGYDLTPMGFFYEDDTRHFHAVARAALDQIDASLYPRFKEAARNYFYIPHRKRERGVGGIFFDHLNTGDLAADLRLWQAVGDSFLEAILPIYQRRLGQPFSREDREEQLRFRAQYVEFNLLYDRGTRFGFLSGGNPDAILCSMPPLVAW